MNEVKKQGFTLLELLIVISIIAILSIALVFMLNPAETLKKARDAQRISDVKTLQAALGLMLTSTSSPSLDGTFGSTAGICLTKGNGTTNIAASKIAYSVATAPASCSATLAAGADAAFAGNFSGCSAGTSNIRTGGWVPVNFAALSGGSPISNIPIDPTNTVSATPVNSDLVYRYACQNGSSVSGKPAFVFEVDATFESQAYTVDDDKRSKDGGDNDNMFEVGNSLFLLPTTAATF